MNTSNFDAKATRVWFDETNLWVSLHDGRQLSVPLAYFPRLLKATPQQRNKFEVSGGGVGIHLGQELRLGFNIDKERRTSVLPEREYRGLKYGTSVTYGL